LKTSKDGKVGQFVVVIAAAAAAAVVVVVVAAVADVKTRC